MFTAFGVDCQSVFRFYGDRTSFATEHRLIWFICTPEDSGKQVGTEFESSSYFSCFGTFSLHFLKFLLGILFLILTRMCSGMFLN